MDDRKRKHPRLKQYDYAQNGCYFITICAKDRKALFGSVRSDPHAGPIIDLSPIGEIIKEFIETISAAYCFVYVDKYVVMPNHIHLLLRIDAPPENDGGVRSRRPTVMTVIRALKSLTTRRAGISLWQSSFYEHTIRNEADYQDIWTYISDNPRKWLDDKYCSDS